MNEINQEFLSLKNDILDIKIQLQQIQEILVELKTSSIKLNNHIDFVETTYDTLKTPLNFIKDKINRIYTPSFLLSSSSTES